MKNIHWLRKGSKIKKIKEEYKLYRMRKKMRFNFYDRDDSAIVKWIHDWIERLGPQHEKQIIDLNNNILDFKDKLTLTENCPDLAETTFKIKLDYWDENKEYTN